LIEDDQENMIFIIDLNKLQVEINQNKQPAFLVKKRLNGEKDLFIDMIYSFNFCFSGWENSNSIIMDIIFING
jgi:hypothetical protein